MRVGVGVGGGSLDPGRPLGSLWAALGPLLARPWAAPSWRLLGTPLGRLGRLLAAESEFSRNPVKTVVFVWFLHGLCMVSVRFLYGLCMFLYGFCIISVCFLHDFCLISVCFLRAFCVISVWFLYDVCVVSVWFLLVSVRFLCDLVSV